MEQETPMNQTPKITPEESAALRVQWGNDVTDWIHRIDDGTLSASTAKRRAEEYALGLAVSRERAKMTALWEATEALVNPLIGASNLNGENLCLIFNEVRRLIYCAATEKYVEEEGCP